MISTLDHPATEQSASIDFAESLKQAVIDQTDNGSRIVRSVISIMEGNAPNCTPWHQLEAAKLLHKLCLGNTPKINPSQRQPVIPAEAGIQSGVDVAGEEKNPSHPSHPVSPGHQMSDAHTKFTNKLIRQIRVDTGDGASIVRYLIEIMEGEDPTTKGRDRLEAIKMLLGICLDSPVFPDAEFMMQAARCHPDCFCVCEDLPEDHPEVAKMHTPLTAEQRERIAEQQAQQEERDRRIDEQIEQKKRADRARKLERFHDPTAKEDRRIEREEQRERRQQKREQEQRQKKDRMRDLRERIGRETRFDTWQHHQQEQERARSP